MAVESHCPPFTYTGLRPGEIRLLRPDNHDEIPAWVLETVSLDSATLDFDALSYTWGSQNKTYPITCNGQSMRVHHNLYSALPFLARRMGELTHRPIWVDAVCIDQKNDDEKRVQIQLMNILYGRAKRVWVWLSCASLGVQSYIPQAIDLLPHIVEEARRRKASAYIWGKEEVALPLRGLEPNCWKAILHLLRNSWYSRVWIIQEAALASDIVFLCGAHNIDATLLESAVASDMFTSWRVTDASGKPFKLLWSLIDNSTVFWIRDLVQGGKNTLSLDTSSLLLRTTLLMTGSHSCFLPRDRVLGMLGLVEKNELASFGVDFHACTSIATLYTQFTTYLLLNCNPNETQFWWPLFNLAFTFEKIDGLPSWVPDFHHQGGGSSYVCTTARISEFGRSSKQYCASARRTTVRPGPSLGELVLRGRILDEVVLVHPPGIRNLEKTGRDGEEAKWLASVAEWQEDIAQRVLPNYDHEKEGPAESEMQCVSEEVYWKTLLGNNFLDKSNNLITMHTCRLFRNIMNQVRQWCEWSLESTQRYANPSKTKTHTLRCAPFREAAGVEELPHEIKAGCSLQSRMTSSYQSLLVKLVKLGDRQLFNTKNGRFGFTIKGVQPGDMLCVFNSASTPHVLRRVAVRGGEAYLVIGDAYVDGLMLAEADDIEVEDREILLV
jgi:hypothetical protein